MFGNARRELFGMSKMNFFFRWLQSNHPLKSNWPVAAMLVIAWLISIPVALADPWLSAEALQSREIMIAQADSGQSGSRRDARAMVQLMNQLDGLNLELSKLRGKVEELSNSILNAEKRQKDMYLDLDTRLRRIEASNAEIMTDSGKAADTLADLRTRVEKLEQAAAASAAVAPPVSTVFTESQAGNADVLRAYEAAMAKYRAGQYQDAISAFQLIIRQYPQHPLAVNAQYWTGDSFYQLRAYRSAVDAQKELIEKHPNSAKAADAMLNMGSAMIGLDDVASARQTWEKLIATYPGSRAAKNAQERLQRLP